MSEPAATMWRCLGIEPQTDGKTDTVMMALSCDAEPNRVTVVSITSDAPMMLQHMSDALRAALAHLYSALGMTLPEGARKAVPADKLATDKGLN